MTGSHHGNNSDDEVIMGTIVMTGRHHGNNSDDWQSAQLLLQHGEL